MANPEWDNYDRQCTICRYPIGSLPFKGDGDGRGQRFAHASCFDLRELQRVSKNLLKKLNDVEKSLEPIYGIAYVHGVYYEGPTYEKEYNEVKRLVQYT